MFLYFPHNIKPEQLRTIQPDKSINNLLYLKNHKLLAIKIMLSPKTSIYKLNIIFKETALSFLHKVDFLPQIKSTN